MIHQRNYEMIEPKGDFVERFWKVTLPRYRRKKKIKIVFSSIAGIFLIFALILFLKTSFTEKEIFVEDVWDEAFALIQNEPNYYEAELVWITNEDLKIYEQIKNENK